MKWNISGDGVFVGRVKLGAFIIIIMMIMMIILC